MLKEFGKLFFYYLIHYLSLFISFLCCVYFYFTCYIQYTKIVFKLISAFLFLVGFLWGATNPFIKKSSAVMNNISFDSVFKQIFVILKFYVTNWKVGNDLLQYILKYII